ncbi:aminoglycoside phosphotransferase family protein [Insolitispirillum peregrinum]|uniref:aminoglycoside phosphotransferase family protein n=1 Tax=Insolitispirillum peregrinum TaxID=80876 RepID=UPI003618BEA3
MRETLLTGFQQRAGWGDAERSLLAGDASFRKYWRLRRADGATMVIMDAPPPQEDVRPFVRVANHLEALGFSVPHVVLVDEDNGFLLLEDLGDGTYTRLLQQGNDEWSLYALATDVLAELSQQPVPADVPAYDDQRLLTETGLLPDWFLTSVGAAVSAEARAEWDRVWLGLLPVARGVPSALVLRDYHVDNLLLLPGRAGLAACGLLDFQDAVVGPLTYDLMSLLEDARRDIDPALVAAMTARFLVARPDLHAETFAASWAVMAAQRHAKVIGIFARLYKRDGKPGYLPHIPRVWRLLEKACQHPACAPVQAWLQAYVPPAVRRRSPQ